MPDRQLRISLDFSEEELASLDGASRRLGVSVTSFIRDASLRAASHGAPLSRSPAFASEPPPSRRSLRPRRSDAKMPTHEMARQLTTHLGIRLLSLTLAADTESVESWAEKKDPLPEPFERRLHSAHEIWQLVCSVESPITVRTWWMGMKDGLDGLSPAEAIALDRYDDVRAVARYFLEAG